MQTGAVFHVSCGHVNVSHLQFIRVLRISFLQLVDNVEKEGSYAELKKEMSKIN